MNEVAAKIEVGRMVRFFAGYGGIDGQGAIYAIHGTPNHAPAQSWMGGVVRVIRAEDCTVDVVLLDGRTLKGIHQCGIDRPGIGIKMQDEVISPAQVEAALQHAAQYEAAQVLARAKKAQDFLEAEAARVIDNAPIFYWNGIKDAKGDKLQKAHYSAGALYHHPAGTITIYARDYARFSAKVGQCFAIQNDTDTMVDYFESDRIRVVPQHPLYPQVKAALDAQEQHNKAQTTKRNAKYQAAA